MPRPIKCRRVCCLPKCTSFVPTHSQSGSTETNCPIILSVDEYETIRIINYEGKNQEYCATQMEVSRTTVTAIYMTAREKIAKSLVEGRTLFIQGGNFKECPIACCCRNNPSFSNKEVHMKLAITYKDGSVFQHFGHTEFFKIYTIEQGQIVSSEIVPTNGSGHGALADFLQNLGVTSLICGGIGGGAKEALAEKNIVIYGGVTGNADEKATDLLAGKLVFNPDVMCSHHDHEHEEGHTCGNHSCESR